MQTEVNDRDNRTVEELLAPALGAPQVQDNITYSIQRLVIQCGALLRQQLERQARNGNSDHSEADVDRIMFQFQTTSPQIEAAIADEVGAFALERIGRVFNNALSDGVDALETPMRGDGEVAIPHTGQHGTLVTPGSTPTRIPENGSPASAAPKPGSTAPTSTPSRQQPSLPGPGGTMKRSVPETYQGAVNLTIESGRDPGQVVNFINALRQTQGVLLTQLMGDTRSGSSIQVKLPAPVALKDVLLGMEGVSQVDVQSWGDQKGNGVTLTVHLRAAAN